jgi:hypothetical protein
MYLGVVQPGGKTLWIHAKKNVETLEEKGNVLFTGRYPLSSTLSRVLFKEPVYHGPPRRMGL